MGKKDICVLHLFFLANKQSSLSIYFTKALPLAKKVLQLFVINYL